ncbi:MAG: phosphatase PAP2 family protein [Phycisphaerales bacterium]|nr:phosphatase PAP2 family protein [Phycisphaerales bacterium]
MPPSRFPRIAIVLAGLLLAACPLSYHLLDKPITRAVDQLSPGVVLPWRIITELGFGLPYLVGLAVLFVILRRRPQHRIAANRCAFAWCAIVVAGAIVNAVKLIAYRPRPGPFLTEGRFGFTLFCDGPDAASFPSGHAATIAAVCLTLCLFHPRRCVWWLTLMVAVALSRVIIAWHFLSDVFAGIAVSSMVIAVLVVIFERRRIDLWQSDG